MKTEVLFNELNFNNDLDDIIDNSQFLNLDFVEVVHRVMEANKLGKSVVIKESLLNITHGYQVFTGRRSLTRNTCLQLIFGLRADVEQARYILRALPAADLYPRVKRDAIILYGLVNYLTLLEVEELLLKYGEESICKTV